MDPLAPATSAMGIPALDLPRIPALVGERGTTVTPYQSKALMGQAMEAKTGVLEYHDRVATLRQKHLARADGAKALADLQGLDPRDPHYLDKRNAVIAQYPSASLDDSVNNFLGLQADVFTTATREREKEADLEYRGRSLLAKTEQEKRDAEQKFLTGEFQDLSPLSQQAYSQGRQQGLDHASSLTVAGRIERNEQEILTLLEDGFTEEEVLGMLDEDGLIQPRQRAAAIGRKKVAAKTDEEKKAAETANRRQLEDSLRDLGYQRKDAERADDVDPETLARIDAELTRVRAALGIPTPNATLSAPVTTNPITGKPVPDKAVDAFFGE